MIESAGKISRKCDLIRTIFHYFPFSMSNLSNIDRKTKFIYKHTGHVPTCSVEHFIIHYSITFKLSLLKYRKTINYFSYILQKSETKKEIFRFTK